GAAVYAASEGLNAVIIEANAPGGQAGTSSRIENYLGFPLGISGQELASRAYDQAQKFGARVLIAKRAMRLGCDRKPFRVLLDGGDGDALLARAVIIEANAPGGQAGTSSRIENYLGFPLGISGQELASRAYDQAQKFGARVLIAKRAMRLGCDRKPFRVLLDGGDGDALLARAVI